MDAFVSHSSGDNATAERLASELEDAGLRVWTDISDTPRGPLVDARLLSKIRGGDLLLLLWSLGAEESPWVAAEWLVAFHEGKLIVPCVLDATPVPPCLRKAARVDMSWRLDRIVDTIARTAARARDARTQIVLPARGRRAPELDERIRSVIEGQRVVLDALHRRDLATAQAKQSELDAQVDDMTTRWPHDTSAAAVEGHHRKNAYQIAYHVRVGLRPPDPVLEKAQRCFLRALDIDPTAHAALSGLGSYRWFLGELETAEFFTLRAIECGRKAGVDVSAYERDLRLVRQGLATGALRPEAAVPAVTEVVNAAD